MNKYQPLTDLQWERLKHLFPVPVKRGRGKPHSPWRSVVNSVLFVLIEDAKWGSWPKTPDFASKSAAHRWFLCWDKNGQLQQILDLLREMLPEAAIASPQRRYHGIREVELTEEQEMPLFFEMDLPRSNTVPTGV